MDKAALILHPVRARIVQALARGRHTAGDLRAELPDVAVTTLYRQLGKLVEGGLLRVVAETQVRGAVERTYELDVAAARIEREEGAEVTPEQYRAAFAAYTMNLSGELERYLASLPASGAEPMVEGLRFVQVSGWFDADELESFQARLSELVRTAGGGRPGGGRRRFTFATATVPAPTPTPTPTDGTETGAGSGPVPRPAAS
ncbi:helix-turn-helix domain-containing protein [Streptomyces sp. NPDC055078]